MASQMVVPASTDTLFFRNFMSNQGKEAVCDFFEREANSPVHVEFFKQSDIDGRLYIALRFESKDIAKDILNRFDGEVVLGDRIQVSWFKDLRKARQKHHFHDRRYGNQGKQGGRGGGGWNSGGGGDAYYRSNREWEEENYNRGRSGGGDYDRGERDREYSYRGPSNRGGRDSRRQNSSERHHRSSKYDRSSSRSASRSRSPTPERRRDSRSPSPAVVKEKRRRSKSQKTENSTLRSTVREVSPAKSDRSGASKDRSHSRDRRDDDADWGGKRGASEYSDYKRGGGGREGREREEKVGRDEREQREERESSSPEKSPPPPPRPSSRHQSPPLARNNSPPPQAPPPKAYRDPRSDKFTRSPFYPVGTEDKPEERRSVQVAKQDTPDDFRGGASSYQDSSFRTYSPAGSNSRGGREASPPSARDSVYSRGRQQDSHDYRGSPMETSVRSVRTRSPEPPAPLPKPRGHVEEERGAFQPMDTSDPDMDMKRRKKDVAAAAADPWQQQQHMTQQRPARVPASDPLLPGLNGGLNRELDRVVGDFGLSSSKMALLREKKDDIERAYRNDCETFATVVKMLISKDPLLEDKLQLSLRENLKDIGQRCIYELREYIDRVRGDDQ